MLKQAGSVGTGPDTSCVTQRGITGQQIHAIVDKYILDNPAQSHMSLILLVRNALDGACR